MLTVLQGDALTMLRTLQSESVQMCCTSPPYWGLRCYGCEGQLGLEPTPELYVERMVEVFREVRRVLRKDGTLWLNLGDSYAGGGRGGGSEDCKQRTNVGSLVSPTPMSAFRPGAGRADGVVDERGQRNRNGIGPVSGIKAKDLCGIPWRVAFALQSDGWYLRSDIIWAKPNPMPESVTDRPTKAHEYVFLLTRSANYFYDAEAIREKGCDEPGTHRGGSTLKMVNGSLSGDKVSWHNHSGGIESLLATGYRNKRSVWTVPTNPYPDAHFATYPPDLISPMILAGTSARGCCSHCGAPWERMVQREVHTSGDGRKHIAGGDKTIGQGWEGVPRATLTTQTLGWQPTCPHNSPPTPCTVLDPFAGSGTTGQVALELGRKATLIELNPTYVQLIQQRCTTTIGLPLA